MVAPRESILRSLWDVNVTVKDNIKQTIVGARQQGRLTLEEKDLVVLLALLDATVDSTYQTSSTMLERVIDKQLSIAASGDPSPKKSKRTGASNK
jgi:hypothetical protein